MDTPPELPTGFEPIEVVDDAALADLILCDDRTRAHELTQNTRAEVVYVGDDLSDIEHSDLLHFVSTSDFPRALPLLIRGHERVQISQRNVLGSMNDAPWGLAIVVDGTIVFCNPALAEFLGETVEALLGTTLRKYIHTDDRPADSPESGRSALVRMIGADGTSNYARFFQSPARFRGADGLLTLVLPYSGETEDQLLLQERLASVGTMAAGIAHELNNPLAYLLTNLQLCREEIRRDADVSPNLLELIDASIGGAHRMSDILKDLRTFSRAPTTAPEVVDVRAVLDTSLQLCRNEIRHRAKLATTIDANPVNVEINASRLSQVFVNLLMRAARAAEAASAAGLVEVELGTDEQGWAVVRIRDNGPGISAADMVRIFEPYYSMVGHGDSGLGLLISRNIVTGAGGELRVESTIGLGTTFEIVLPATSAAVSKKPVSSKPPERSAAARVLVIDDETLIGRAIERALRDHDVTTETSPEAALERLKIEDYDLVLCDLMMPGLSGIELFEIVVAKRPELAEAFVFMTGGAFTERAKEFLRTTSVSVIDKPFNLKDLRALAVEYAGRRSDSLG